MGEFEGKVAVVTGGSRGIGRGIALRLADEGAHVVITYHKDADSAAQVISAIEQKGARGIAYQNDGADFEGVKVLLRQIRSDVGEVHYLVNNAGIGINKSFYLMSESDWDSVLSTNLKSVFNFTRNLAIDLIKRKSGAIVNITSVAGIKGLSGQVNYCSSKAGIIAFTKALAREIGKTGVRVNAVAPGYINTDMTSAMPAKLVESYLEQIPCGRFGEPDDVAEAVLFLLSEKSKYICGETIVVDGGLSL